MQMEICVCQNKPRNGDGHIGETDVLNFTSQELDEGTCRTQQELIEGSLNDIFLQFPEVPEEKAVEAVTQQPQAIQEEELPNDPTIQVDKAIDDNANQAEGDRIQVDYSEHAHDEISAILQTRLHGEADQSEVKAQGFYDSTSLDHEAAMRCTP